MLSSATTADRRSDGREIVLFHSVLGLRSGVLQWAERFRAAGHTVHTPDLYDGQVFDDLESGLREMEARGGIEALIERSYSAVAELPADVVYAGFSNGGGSAELLALTRAGALGAILMHAALPVEAFGAEAWPASVPIQIHYAEQDPFRDQQAIDALTGAAKLAGAPCEVWNYPGSGHLFADPDLPDFNASSAEPMFQHTLDFLRRIPTRH